MWRWAIRILIGLCGLIIVAAITGATYQWTSTRNDLAANPPPGQLIDVGGHNLHIWCTGSGEPTVILEAGLGGSSLDWGYVQPEVAPFTRVCSYDRAGMGYSDPGPSPRTAGRIAQELAQLLHRVNINGPLILVGASIGGFPARVFASKHPERIAGLVLVDASHEDQEVQVPRIAPLVPLLASTGVLRLFGVTFGPAPESLPPSVQRFARATNRRTVVYQTVADEMVHLPETAQEVRATRRRLTAPVVVVTAGLSDDPRWQDWQRDQVELSEQGCQIIAKRSGHFIAVGQPEAIVAPIRAIVQRARGRPHTALCQLP